MDVQVVSRRYKISKELARGGFGDTFLAFDTHKPGNYKCLLKHLKPIVTDPHVLKEAKRLFDQEAIILETLGVHDQIPEFFDHFEENQEFYIVQDYIEGHDLTEELPPVRSLLSESEVIIILQEILEVLAFVHQNNVIHRDIKPSNIRRRQDGKIVLIDFGAVKQIATPFTNAQGETVFTIPIGTPGYMPSEQASGKPRFSSDIYAVGIIGIQALTGIVPSRYGNKFPTDPVTGEIIWRDKAKITVQLADIIDMMVRYDFRQRYQTAEAALEALKNITINTVIEKIQIYESAPTVVKQALIQKEQNLSSTIESPKKRIFISYKRNAQPDETVALQVFQTLSLSYQVFIDQAMVVGTVWAERIEAEINTADFLIIFLSAQSINSEMVEAELSLAHDFAASHGRPTILPVRLAYREPFQYPLNIYLNHINWAFWQRREDTPRLIAELTQAVEGGKLTIGEQAKADLIQINKLWPFSMPFPSAQTVRLEMPEGTMESESAFYVERPSDAIALETIKGQGVTITIKGPRQMGKSSLLIRTINAALNTGKRAVFLDFQLFDKATLTNADQFYRQFCCWLTEELEMADRVNEYWNNPLGNSQCCTRYVGRYLLKELNSPIVLAMDEMERLFDTDFQSDFFGMLRSWHNQRATSPIWKRLDLAMVTSTEPYLLIDNLNQSPFNVGQIIDLEDFTPIQVADLNRRHNSPLNQKEEQQLFELLNGHPYLVRLALYVIASHRLPCAELFANATADNSPFGNHLRNHMFRLYNKPELVKGMLQVIHQNMCEDERVFFQLRGAGLVRRSGRKVIPRCQLYAKYFRDYLYE